MSVSPNAKEQAQQTNAVHFTLKNGTYLIARDLVDHEVATIIRLLKIIGLFCRI